MATRTKVLPNSEGALTQYAENFLKQMTDHTDEYHLTEEELQQVQDVVSEWVSTADAATTARDAARAATEAKDAARVAMEETLRTRIRLIQANPAITDQAKLEAGIRPHKTTRTPIRPPHTSPIGSVIASDQLTQTLFISDAATPTKRARPSGVTGCEIYLFVGDAAPADPKAFRMIRFATRSPEEVTFEAADGGRTAHYLLRWMNSKGETGPWSNVISATIPAV